MSNTIIVQANPIISSTIGGGTVHTAIYGLDLQVECLQSSVGDVLPLLASFRNSVHGTSTFQCLVTDLAGFKYEQPDFDFGNTVSNEYGFYCTSVVTGSNKYGFYAEAFSSGGYPLYLNRGTNARVFIGPNLGVGGTDALVPAEPLVVVSQNASAIVAQFRGNTGNKEIAEIASFSASHVPTLRGWGSSGTFTSPSATQDDGVLLRLAGTGTNNAGTPAQTGVVASIEFAAAQNFTTANQGTQILFKMCPANSTTLTTFVTMEAGLVTVTGQTTPEIRLDSSGDTGEYLAITRTSTNGVGQITNHVLTPGQSYSLKSAGGAGDFVEFGTSFQGDTDGISISMWIKPNTMGAQNFYYVRGQDGSGNGWSLGIYQLATNVLRFSIVTSAPAQVDATTTTVLATDTWYHVGAVWQPGTGLKIYLNGTLEQTTANAATQLRSSGVGTRWFRDNDGSAGVDGRIDAVNVWIGTFIGDAEMASLAAGNDPTTSPTHQYKTNEGSGTTVNDTGSSVINGTINGSITYSTDIPSQNPLPASGSTNSVAFVKAQDGTVADCAGIFTFGNSIGRSINQGGQSFKRTASATDYTAKVSDFIIGITSTAAARTVTLPQASLAGEGMILIVKDESGAAGTNNITIDGDGSETIDGATTKVINTNYGIVRLYCTGATWFTW